MRAKRFQGSLTVTKARKDDVYKDVVRINEKSRGDLRAGRVHKFCTIEKSAYFILRGSDEESDVGKILMDDASRNTMGLLCGQKYIFEIIEVGFWGELRWAWGAVDPTYKVAARLGVISFALGLVAVLPLARDILADALAFVRHLICG